jgi:hypothetical protein
LSTYGFALRSEAVVFRRYLERHTMKKYKVKKVISQFGIPYFVVFYDGEYQGNKYDSVIAKCHDQAWAHKIADALNK